MTSDLDGSSPSGSNWKVTQVYTMAAVCLVLGVALGYLFRGSKSVSPAPVSGPAAEAAPPAAPGGGTPQMPTLEQMKKMADTKAAPLLEKLKSDPGNADLIVQVAKTYESTHQFKQAGDYYQQALTANPKDSRTRIELASCLYYTGDVDGAITQLQQSLKDDPKNADAQFNLGMIRWQGKNDAPGALAEWQHLLKSNPKLDPTRKAQVQKLIADAQLHGKGDFQSPNH